MVTNPHVIDIVSVNQETGFVELILLDENEWPSVNTHLDWLAEKLAYYVSFVKGSTMQSLPAYANRQIKIIAHFKGRPQVPIRQAIYAIAERMRSLSIGFSATETGNIADEVNLHEWPMLPEQILSN